MTVVRMGLVKERPTVATKVFEKVSRWGVD